MAFTNKEFQKFRDFIYNATGIWFSENKKNSLFNKISSRMQKIGIDSLNDYFSIITSIDDRGEYENLINEITTNETYFFRNKPQFDALNNFILPKIISEKIAKNEKKIRIWSAGCSTGEEPYSISISLLEQLRFASMWDIYILATDISTEVLLKAEEGRYNEKAIKMMDSNILKKYFEYNDSSYIIKDSVKKLVKFEYQNLVDVIFEKDMDIIFCRNVLIYFKEDFREKLLDKFYFSLKNGGYFFVGHSEMIRDKRFKMIFFKDTILYQKVEG